MDRGAWQATVQGVIKSRTRLSDFISLLQNLVLWFSVLCFEICFQHNIKAFLVAQMVKNLPTMQDTRVQSLGRENPLEKGMATHSSILAWRVPWTEEPGDYSPWDHKESDMTEAT